MSWTKLIGSFLAVAVSLGFLVLAPPARAQLNCNVGVEYYPDGGGIKRCQLNGYHTLYTARGLKVTCADGKTLEQYPDGAVQRCSIESIHVFDGVRCEPPSEVTFERDGRLRECKRS